MTFPNSFSPSAPLSLPTGLHLHLVGPTHGSAASRKGGSLVMKNRVFEGFLCFLWVELHENQGFWAMFVVEISVKTGGPWLRGKKQLAIFLAREELLLLLRISRKKQKVKRNQNIPKPENKKNKDTKKNKKKNKDTKKSQAKKKKNSCRTGKVAKGLTSRQSSQHRQHRSSVLSAIDRSSKNGQQTANSLSRWTAKKWAHSKELPTA